MKFKHTIICEGCNKTQQFDNITNAEYATENKSKCCNTPYEYIGLQPFIEDFVIVTKKEKNDNMEIIKQKEVTIQEIQPKEEIQSKEEPINNLQIKIEDIITPGPRGITKAQMVPVMKANIDEGNSLELKILKQHYPEIFESSIYYINNKYKARLQELLN